MPALLKNDLIFTGSKTFLAETYFEIRVLLTVLLKKEKFLHWFYNLSGQHGERYFQSNVLLTACVTKE